MTVVLVKRAATPVSRSFRRSLDSLAGIFEFAAAEVDEELRPAIELALEELFTNAVKYGRRSDTPLTIEIRRIAEGVEVSLVDADAEPYDPTQAPAVDITLPLERRRPGGLGIHLVRKVVDSIEYRYAPESRTGLTTFRKTRGKADVQD